MQAQQLIDRVIIPGQFSTQALAIAVGIREKVVQEVLAGKAMTEEFVAHLVELQPQLNKYRGIVCDVSKEEWLAWPNAPADTSQILPNKIVIDFEDIQPITSSSEFLPWLNAQQGVTLNACLKALSNITSNRIPVVELLTEAGYFSSRSRQRVGYEQVMVWWWNPLQWCLSWGGHSYHKHEPPPPKPPVEKKKRSKADFYDFYYAQVAEWLELKKSFHWFEIQNTFVRPYVTEKTRRELALKAVVLDVGFDYSKKAKQWCKVHKKDSV